MVLSVSDWGFLGSGMAFNLLIAGLFIYMLARKKKKGNLNERERIL